MNALDLNEVHQYVSENIDEWHKNRIRLLSEITFRKLLQKNPYLFRAKELSKASEFVDEAMSALRSSSEEKEFGNFLEELAIFITRKTSNGHKSGATGVDLEFEIDSIHYFVSIKSGPNWGNSSQHRRLGQDLQNAVNVFRQNKGQRSQVDSVLGICYGKTRTTRNSKFGYLKLVGQNFWTFISGNKELYTDIIEPLGFRAEEYKEQFHQEQDRVANLLTKQVIENFCDENGTLDWERVVQVFCGNYDLDNHGFNY